VLQLLDILLLVLLAVVVLLVVMLLLLLMLLGVATVAFTFLEVQNKTLLA